jgi:hypothetical protein
MSVKIRKVAALFFMGLAEITLLMACIFQPEFPPSSRDAYKDTGELTLREILAVQKTEGNHKITSEKVFDLSKSFFRSNYDGKSELDDFLTDGVITESLKLVNLTEKFFNDGSPASVGIHIFRVENQKTEKMVL